MVEDYKSKLRSHSNVQVPNKKFESTVKLDISSYVTPYPTKRMLKRRLTIMSPPPAPKCLNRTITEETPGAFELNTTQNFEEFEKTPKRRSLRKSKLSVAPNDHVHHVFHQENLSAQVQTEDFDAMERVRELESEIMEIRRQNVELKEDISALAAENVKLNDSLTDARKSLLNLSQQSESFSDNVRSLASRFSRITRFV